MKNQSGSSRKPVLGLLAVVVLVGLVSLPWQREQWHQLQKARQEREVNERRLRSVEQQKRDEQAAVAQLQMNPASPEAKLDRIRLLLSQQQTSPAIDGLVAFEQEYAADPGVWQALSDLFKEIGYSDKALFYARKSVEQDPRSSVALTQLAYLELTFGWRTEAMAHIRSAIENSPKDPSPLLAMALFHHNNSNEAIKFARRAYELQPDNWRVAAILARDLANGEKYEEALALLDKAQSKHPDEPQVYLYIADISWDRWKNEKQGSNIKSSAMKRAKENALRSLEMAPYDAAPCFLLGRIAEEEQDVPLALSYYEREFLQHPQNSQNTYRYSQLLLHKGTTAEQKKKGQSLLAKYLAGTADAERFNKLVLNASKTRSAPEPHRVLARYSESVNRLPLAILEWEEVLRIVPKDAEATQNIARLKTRRGDLTVAPR